jgi:hypothetical protein
MATQTGTSSGTGASGTSGTAGGTRMGTGTQSGQGTSDVTYNLISVLYHTLQGCETYQKYAQDAERGGRQDIAQFFRDTLDEEQRRAQRGQQLLMQCLQSEQGGSGQMLQGGSGAQGQQAAGGAQGQQAGGGTQGQRGGNR